MPLPSVKFGAKLCQAKSKRTGLPCKNVAAHQCATCRLHGARKSRIALKGENHPNYRHGLATDEKRRNNAESSTRLRYLIDIGQHIDLFNAKTGLAGRPPNSYKKLNLSDPTQLTLALHKTK